MTPLPKHYWEGKDANGNTGNIANTTLEPPLGNGPYKVEEDHYRSSSSPMSVSRITGPKI